MADDVQNGELDRLTREFARLSLRASMVGERLRADNSLPDDFPKAQLIELTAILRAIPEGVPEEAVDLLVNAHEMLAEAVSTIATEEETPDAEDAPPPPNRDDGVGAALEALIGTVSTVLIAYRLEARDSASQSETPPGTQLASGAPEVETAGERAERIAEHSGKVAGEVADHAASEKAAQAARRAKDLDNSARLGRLAHRWPRVRLDWLERIARGLDPRRIKLEQALDAIDVASDLAEISWKRWNNFLTESVRCLFDEIRGWTADIRELKAKRGGGSGSPFRPLSIFRDRFADGSEGPELVVIPAGEFWMGSTAEEQERFELREDWRKWESPRHLVRIERPFALGRYPVTFEEYDAYCEAADIKKPDDKKWGRSRRPVINVSHDDAMAYCSWLSAGTGAEYRLPSEAEWEYACRARTETAYWWGEDWDGKRANDLQGGPGKTTEVGEYDANPWGLYDTHGNVWEWCADHWSESYDAPRLQSPFLSDYDRARRVLRGGSWNNYPGILRSADRIRAGPDFRSRFIGFRLSRTLTP